MMQNNISFRSFINENDLPVFSDILRSTEFFYEDEINIAIEVAQEHLSKGEEKSGYSILLAEKEGVPVAFAIYGKIPGTKDSFDLYWIAVHDDHRGEGVGKMLLRQVEQKIADLSGRHIWIETSSRSLYNPTRKFYLKMGYRVTAELPHFYATNDNKIIFVKLI